MRRDLFTLPNLLSILRLPLALLFLKQDPSYRLSALSLAMISDGLDGFLARRYRLSSRVGTLLDPLMDRFFVFVVSYILMKEHQLALWQAGTLFCRDLAVLLFGLYLVCKGKLTTYRFRAIWCGKATTFLQFLVFFGIIWGIAIPHVFFSLFILLGILALLELYISKESLQRTIS